MQTLHELWLKDQSLAFAATLLADGPHLLPHLRHACAETVIEGTDCIKEGMVSDSTLWLVRTIADDYRDTESLADAEIDDADRLAAGLGEAIDLASKQLNRREEISDKYLNRILVSHAVYVLKRPHMSAEKFLKWLHRWSRKATPGITAVLKGLATGDQDLRQRLESSLESSRDRRLQTRDRLDNLDDFFAFVLEAAGPHADTISPWWTRICLGYRNSLFCWPLLVYVPEGADDDTEGTDAPIQRGISLPIGLFLLPDGKSSYKPAGNNAWGQHVWFKHVLSKRVAEGSEAPRFVPADGEVPAHMGESHFGWTKEWAYAFQVGMDVAKKLWTPQNGRLRYANAEAAERLHTSSLNVDLAAANDIVDSIFERPSKGAWERVAAYKSYFVATGRSAEAYWVQCVLGLLLPGREVPLGVCTGFIEYEDGEYEMKEVEGLPAKLEFANRSGIPRVIIPGDRSEYADDDEDEEPSENGKAVWDLLARLSGDNSRKTSEVNFCRTARAAADAMQSSGWRRTEFVRLPGLQRRFGSNQRRLFIRDALGDPTLREKLKPRDVEWYKAGNMWRDGETYDLEQLDHVLLSDKDNSVKYASRDQIRNCFPPHIFESAEAAVGKWLAWKDNQVRSGELSAGYRGPGLGILSLRTAEGDNEARLWAALAEILNVDEEWWGRFQWSDLPECADMLAELLGNQRADPDIGIGSAPDILVIFDDAGLTRRRHNTVFPTHFNKQFYDLLNPRHPDNNKPDYLDKALKRLGVGPLQHITRVIVIYGEEPETTPTDLESLSAVDRRALEKLAVFRFGFPRQAAFSMINYLKRGEERASWGEVEETVDRLIEAKVLWKSRNMLFIPDRVRAQLSDHSLKSDPQAHLHAARALCPILQPSKFFVAANRDRQLEPEMVLEASWHLDQAYALVPGRFRYKATRHFITRDSATSDAQALLTFLRTSPDLDTIKKLRVNGSTSREAIDLCFELEEKKLQVSGKHFSPADLGLMIETIGWHSEYQAVSEKEAEAFCSVISSRVDAAMERLSDPASAADARYRCRFLRFLFSRQIFAMRTLKTPLDDTRLTGARAYLDNSITEALSPNLLNEIGKDFGGLEDFPIAHKYWERMWNDEEFFTPRERSTFAYAAARTNLGMSRNGVTVRHPWDLPWIIYFGLARIGELDRNQIVDPLDTWNNVYGQSEEDAIAFGRRILDMRRHARRVKSGWTEGWLKDINDATLNVWQFIAHPTTSVRLYGNPIAHALRFLRVIASPETLTLYHLLTNGHPSWMDAWPKIAQQNPEAWNYIARTNDAVVADAWRALAREVVASSAGWVAMLASLESIKDENWRLNRVRAWLFALEALDTPHLVHSDPESLIKHSLLKISHEYIEDRRRGVDLARGVLASRNEKGFALFGHLRTRLFAILGQLCNQGPGTAPNAPRRSRRRPDPVEATPVA